MHKIIGIIGGSGPEAGIKYCENIIEIAHKKYGAVLDTDFPHFILSSRGLNGFNEKGIMNADLVYTELLEEVLRLKSAGCYLIVIACNTLHCFIERLRAGANINILDMIQTTLESVSKAGMQKAGLLCSETTNRMKLYKSEKLDLIYPNLNQQFVLNEIVLNVMAGRAGNEDFDSLGKIISNYISNGAEAIILGCTELPLIGHNIKSSIPMFDSMKIAAEQILDKSEFH